MYLFVNTYNGIILLIMALSSILIIEHLDIILNLSKNYINVFLITLKKSLSNFIRHLSIKFFIYLMKFNLMYSFIAIYLFHIIYVPIEPWFILFSIWILAFIIYYLWGLNKINKLIINLELQWGIIKYLFFNDILALILSWIIARIFIISFFFSIYYILSFSENYYIISVLIPILKMSVLSPFLTPSLFDKYLILCVNPDNGSSVGATINSNSAPPSLSSPTPSFRTPSPPRLYPWPILTSNPVDNTSNTGATVDSNSRLGSTASISPITGNYPLVINVPEARMVTPIPRSAPLNQQGLYTNPLIGLGTSFSRTPTPVAGPAISPGLVPHQVVRSTLFDASGFLIPFSAAYIPVTPAGVPLANRPPSHLGLSSRQSNWIPMDYYFEEGLKKLMTPEHYKETLRIYRTNVDIAVQDPRIFTLFDPGADTKYVYHDFKQAKLDRSGKEGFTPYKEYYLNTYHDMPLILVPKNRISKSVGMYPRPLPSAEGIFIVVNDEFMPYDPKNAKHNNRVIYFNTTIDEKRATNMKSMSIANKIVKPQ